LQRRALTAEAAATMLSSKSKSTGGWHERFTA
jgi:hypothetical protein